MLPFFPSLLTLQINLNFFFGSQQTYCIYSSVKESLLSNTNPESSTTVHLVHSKQPNGSTTGQQAIYRDTAVSTTTATSKSRTVEDIDSWSTLNPNSNQSKRKANLQLNRSYSTACTTSGLTSGSASGTHTPKDYQSSSKRKKRNKLTNLKLSLSGGRLAYPSNLK